ncbi:MAG: carboxymuconolactone decarboxylase family protein [Hyphomicrobiaceae bacterium]
MYDTANLSKLQNLRQASPSVMQAFETFDRAAMAPGAIPRRYKELIALAVAITTQCPYSLEVHRTNALNAGVTEAEIAEVVFISAAMRATAAIAHGTHLVGKKS